MPIHDWTRVSAGTYHDFHCTWIPEIKNRLNMGILPPDYYAQVEQVARGVIPDVLTLHEESGDEVEPGDANPGGTAVALAPPKVRHTAIMEMDAYSARSREIVIRHSSNDRVIALIEVLSPGNKSSARRFQGTVDKVAGALINGIHVLLIDLFPPAERDPHGMHAALCAEIDAVDYFPPPDKPLTLASYSAGELKTAYVEPVAVGDSLTPMPLFLNPESYVTVPLEESYMAAFRGVPRRWQRVLDPSLT